MPELILSLQHVYVSRGGPPVLHDISLDLHAGEHLAILGPNGCGKSTLLKTITCELYPLAVGPDGHPPSVSIFGRQRWDLTQLRQRLGVVSAELPGKPTLHTSGLDAILTGFFAASTLWPNLLVTDAMRARAEDLLHQVGAEDLRHRLVGEMSSGQQRRIMIARALAGSRAAAEALRPGAPSSSAASPLESVGSVPPPPIAESTAPGAPSSPAASSPERVGSVPPPPIAESTAPGAPSSPAASPLECVGSVPPSPIAESTAPGAPSSPAASSPERVGSGPQLPSTDHTRVPGEMLLLDEPSNALDLAAQQDLRRLLRELAQQGTTILLITHHTADILPEIDHLLLMRDGRIAADGPKRDLLTAPILSNLFRTPVELTERDGLFHTR